MPLTARWRPIKLETFEQGAVTEQPHDRRQLAVHFAISMKLLSSAAVSVRSPAEPALGDHAAGR